MKPEDAVADVLKAEVHYMCLLPNMATYPGKAGGLKLAEAIFYGDHNRDSTEGPEFFRFSNSNYSYKTPLSYHTKLYFKHYSRDHINRKPKPIRFVSISEMCTKFSEKMIPENESEGTRRNEIELTLLNTLAVSGANEDGLMVTEGSYISNEENI
ncbi:hypothetical protein V6N13_049094 [Hibiscus sabdariffa]